jgi:outer membrane protein OmpA-like peptidoglycan-associated protein
MKKIAFVLCASLVVSSAVPLSWSRISLAQDHLPADNGEEFGEYHPDPAYRESESHPLRILAYIVHPIGWLARELIFRPLSYFASSTPTTREIMGYREPHDIRKPTCFSADDTTPDCRQVAPFNYGSAESAESLKKNVVYFPDVNFDFNKHSLNGAGKRKAQAVAGMLLEGQAVDVELQGHTDKRGSDTYNEKLGMDRARAVKKELVTLGVPEEHLYTVSFGERKPLFEENEGWAHAANRRVEVQLAGHKERGVRPQVPTDERIGR